MNPQYGAALLIFSLCFGLAVPAAAQSTNSKNSAKPAAAVTKKPECAPKDVLCNYIVATRALLADYQTAISGQIATVGKGYTSIAQAAEQGHRDEIETGLMNERNQRSELMADDFIHGTKPIWHWKEYLLEYAALDFQANRELLELESTDGSRFLGGIQNLEAEFSQVQALDKLLAGLNEKQSLVDHLKELGDYAQQTKTQFDTLVCAGLKKDLTAKTDAEKAAAQALTQLKNAVPPDDKAIAQKTAEDNALKDAITQLTKERTSKACKD
jgi:hypothetical protein